jgi:alkaline phosphatase
VILFIGDGMGPQEIGLFLDVAEAAASPPTALGELIATADRSLVRTRSANSPVTDSAAAATAIATGVDTANGRVGVDPLGHPLRTCLEDARDSGRATALVTTTRITHATPACFAAHAPERADENGIAPQLLAARVDILLGGGARHFLGGPGGQSIGPAIEAGGYRVVRSAEELTAAPRDRRLLGLFAASDLPYRIDRDGDADEPAGIPSLAAMTRAALDRLDPARGFFLMVEGGRIDHAGHSNDAAALVGEMIEFDEAVAVARAYAATRPEVALIITADHETGGLCLTYRGETLPKAADLRALANAEASITAEGGRAVTADEARLVFGSARLGFVPEDAWKVNAPALERSAASFVSFGSQGHSATPVLLLHAGAGERLGGLTTHAALGARLRSWMSLAPRSGE